jgi:hypothetical protein
MSSCRNKEKTQGSGASDFFFKKKTSKLAFGTEQQYILKKFEIVRFGWLPTTTRFESPFRMGQPV